MPTPFELLLDPAVLTMVALFAALALWEAAAPRAALPRVPGWGLRAAASAITYLLLSSYLPLLWADALAPLQVFDLSAWPVWAAATAGVLGYEALAYAYHRAVHRFEPLWLACHQMHHSAERLDALGAFWFAPADMVGWTLVTSVALTILGVPPAAATLAILATTFLAIFQHANVRTPRWLGYLVQRPESHAIHHARALHRWNYSDLPVFDLLFGTFRNPATPPEEAGFWDGASRRVFDMLRFRDVSRPPRTP